MATAALDLVQQSIDFILAGSARCVAVLARLCRLRAFSL